MAEQRNLEKYIFRYALAGLFILGLFSVIGALIFISIPPENKDTLNILTGVLASGALVILHFYYSSSKSSDDKTKMLNGK